MGPIYFHAVAIVNECEMRPLSRRSGVDAIDGSARHPMSLQSVGGGLPVGYVNIIDTAKAGVVREWFSGGRAEAEGCIDR